LCRLHRKTYIEVKSTVKRDDVQEAAKCQPRFKQHSRIDKMFSYNMHSMVDACAVLKSGWIWAQYEINIYHL
jgi:hypothetical protein